MPTSVLIVDDHEVVRQGLRAVLEDAQDFAVVGEAGTREDGMRRAAELRPDVAIIDLRLSSTSGLPLVREITDALPETHVIVLSMHSEEAYLVEAVRAGATGYIVKGAPAAEIVQGLRAVARGGTYFGSGLLPEAISAAVNGPPSARKSFSSLSERELDVLRLLTGGLTSKQIGDRLGIGARTVETHRLHMLHKLNLTSPSDLLVYALKHDLLATN